MSQGNRQRIVCVACQNVEVPLHVLACPQCTPQLEALGLLDPKQAEPTPTRLIQIGPLDI